MQEPLTLSMGSGGTGSLLKGWSVYQWFFRMPDALRDL